MQGSFVRYFSHELRNPLNIIVMGLSNLTEGISKRKPKGELIKLINDIEHANENAIEVLDNLLTYGKLALNEIRLDKAVHAVNDLMDMSLRLFHFQVIEQRKESNILRT